MVNRSSRDLIVGRRQHKPYYWSVQWCIKVMQSGWPIAGWSAVLSLLRQLSHLSYEDRVAEVRYNTVSIVRLIQLSSTGGQPSQWTFLHHNSALMLPPPYYYTSMQKTLESLVICYRNFVFCFQFWGTW